MKNWQLYIERNGTIRKLHPAWEDMTEREAETALSKFTQPPTGRLFIAPVGQY